ncbi:MAG: aldehyde:ferredoxin oxidoreductase, partial [Deltaproteobacteria bacterium]|nr:aldehyde:ferredoxin oxidoreductase [Deltaproteobacteria bacterium]
MKGQYDRILRIDVSRQKYWTETVDSTIYEKYLGGKGLASYLLYTLNPPEVDPLHADNCLIFATGPITGSRIWGSSRYGVYTKSPQTGLYSESYSGGRVPEAIDSAGYDAIVIQGESADPIVLGVHPDEVLFHPAADLWGQETYDTEDAILQRYSQPDKGFRKAGAVVIGPAAEKLVRFGVIKNDHWRSAGRTGVGTVLGAKKIKGL